MSRVSLPGERRGAGLVIAIALVVAVIMPCTGGVATYQLLTQRRAQIATRPLGVFWEVWDLLELDFYGDVPSAEVRTYGAIRGALELLDDPYTVILEPQSGEIERNRLAGTYGGIGVDVWRDSAGRVFVAPYPNSPAETAGVQSRDELLAIDGRPIGAASTDEIHLLLRGEVDTTVAVTLSRPPTPPFDLTITRAQIDIPSVTYRLLDEDPTIGYISISNFTERTPRETADALNALTSAGATALVLDLRGNGGGLIRPAVDVTDLFLDSGVVLYEVWRNEQETTLSSHTDSSAWNGPLAVLVNASTASAAEIVAGAIQARGRGTLLGEQTYGKGSVQMIYVLSNGGALHVTAAVWLLPNRQPVEPDGLTPDIRIARSPDPGDHQLERAIRFLQIGE